MQHESERPDANERPDIGAWFRRSGVQWTATATAQLEKYLDLWRASGRPFDELDAIADLMCLSDQGWPMPSLKECARRWNWSVGVTRGFLERHGILARRSHRPVPGTRGDTKGTRGDTGGTRNTSIPAEKTGRGTRGDTEGTRGDTGGTREGGAVYIPEQKVDQEVENTDHTSCDNGSEAPACEAPINGGAVRLTELDELIGEIERQVSAMETGTLPGVVLTAVEMILGAAGYEVRRNHYIPDVGNGEPGRVSLMGRRREGAIGRIAIELTLNAVGSKPVLKLLRTDVDRRLILVRQAKAPPPNPPPKGIDRVVTIGPPEEEQGDPTLGFVAEHEISERLLALPGFIEAWRTFVRWRNTELGSKVTRSAALLNLAKLAKFTNPIAAIENAIAHGWRSVFEKPHAQSRRHHTQSPSGGSGERSGGRLSKVERLNREIERKRQRGAHADLPPEEERTGP